MKQNRTLLTKQYIKQLFGDGLGQELPHTPLLSGTLDPLPNYPTSSLSTTCVILPMLTIPGSQHTLSLYHSVKTIPESGTLALTSRVYKLVLNS